MTFNKLFQKYKKIIPLLSSLYLQIINLYYNMVLDVGMILSVCDSVCSFATETTFPLSNFKTKHIFRIHMTLRKFSKLTGAEGAQNLRRAWHRKFSFLFCYRRRRLRFPGGRDKSRRRWVFREYIYISCESIPMREFVLKPNF